MAKLLVIDDDEMVCDVLRRKLEVFGHEVRCCLTLEDGMHSAVQGDFAAVLLDVAMPDGNGLEFISALKQVASQPEVIIMTGLTDVQTAEAAIRNGAWEFFRKGTALSRIEQPLNQALRRREQRRPRSLFIPGVIAASPAMKSALSLVSDAAASDINVLINGETGSGKEMLAQAIHTNSRRARGSFIVVDCAALPENLVESMLLGHEKGAFTGAHSCQEGLIKQADGGTLFLDEVGELPLPLQKAFLRVLHERRFRPIGSRREVSSDFRLIAATNRNLEEMVARGEFRQDLLFRLKSTVIELPPLRERPEDLEQLVRYYVALRCQQWKIELKECSAEFLSAFRGYQWPGNVRELVHAVDSALAAAMNESTLYPSHLPIHVRISIVCAGSSKEPEAGRKPASAGRIFPPIQELRERALAEAEARYLRELLALTKGSISEACRISQLSRSRLYALLKKYAITCRTKWEDLISDAAC